VSRVGLLVAMMDASYGRLRGRLDGLTDDEFSWRPVPDCLAIHRDESGRWRYIRGAPEPAPVTTIGWLLVHLALCKVMFHEHAYGAARLMWPELEVPHTADAAVEVLERGQGLLRADLECLSDGELDEPRRTHWGQLWPAWRIFSVMVDHDALHGGAIGSLRDLYHWTRRA
jgi:DinB superfamily